MKSIKPSVERRLDEVFHTAPIVPFGDDDKLVFFSDCHRGDNSWADDFAHNQLLFFHALKHYYERGFTYVEVGDGDELWENAEFAEIRRAHSHVFWLMRQFYLARRLFFLFGNHNMDWRDPERVAAELYAYVDERDGQTKELFPEIIMHEGVVLRHRESGGQFFVVHGHQGDLMSDRLWRFSRLSVRYLWRNLQLLGFNDPTSPAQNFRRRNEVEQHLIAWAHQHRQPMICGHTHRSVLPAPDEAPYFNTGSAVHPRCITGIEIEAGEICLIKWWLAPDDEGRLCVTREVLAGPQPVRAYF